MAFTRNGYGQVEPNQLSAQKTGQIYASLPLASDVDILQNGEFMYYDYKSGTVTADSTVGGEPMLVFNEVKLYEPFWQTSYKDFAMIRVGDNYVTSRLATAGYGDGAETTGVASAHSDWQAGYRMDGIAPRLFKTNVGDIFTTNMVATGDNVTYAKGETLKLKKTDRNTLELAKDGDIDTIAFVIVKVYTMPDGQPGLKVQRVK